MRSSIARERGHKANTEDANSGVGIEKTMAKLEHVEKVKSYAPGVMHCVLDIRIEALGVSG